MAKRRSKRRIKRRRKMSAKQAKYFAPKRRRRKRRSKPIVRRKRRRRKSNTKTIVRYQPMARRKRRSSKRSSVRRRGRRRGRKSNSFNIPFLGRSSLGGLFPGNAIMLAGAGALGVLGVGYATAKLASNANAPSWVRDGWGRVATETAVAGLGYMLLKKVAPRPVANAVIAGSLAWIALDAISMLRFGTLNPSVRLAGLGIIDDSDLYVANQLTGADDITLNGVEEMDEVEVY
jgi:hypothetical protein